MNRFSLALFSSSVGGQRSFCALKSISRAVLLPNKYSLKSEGLISKTRRTEAIPNSPKV